MNKPVKTSIEEIYDLAFGKEAVHRFIYNGKTTKRYEFPSSMASDKYRTKDEIYTDGLVDYEDD